jgi:hypothetical protein
MNVYERATQVVAELLNMQRNSNLLVDLRAEVIVRKLAEEGLLIMDPQPNEDEACPVCGRMLGVCDGLDTCDNCGWQEGEDIDVPEGITIPVLDAVRRLDEYKANLSQGASTPDDELVEALESDELDYEPADLYQPDECGHTFAATGTTCPHCGQEVPYVDEDIKRGDR